MLTTIALTRIVGITMAVVAMCAILCNALIIIVICWNRSLKRPLNIFLLNLAIADIGMCCTCVPYALEQIAFKSKGTTSTFCYLGSFLVTFFMTANCLVITAICLYQYLMVTGPLEDTVQGFFFLSIAWTLAACMAVGPIFHWGKYELSSSIFGCSFQSVGKMEYISYNSTLMFVGYGFPLLLFMFCYSSILLAIRDSDTRIAKGWIVASVATDDSCIETGQKRIIMVTLMTVTVFICFRAPLFVSLLLNTLKVANKWLQIADQIAFWALYFHAALDPFVYAFQQGEYCKTLGEIATTLKRGFLECCCCCCCDNGVREGERRRGKRESSLPKIEEEQCE